MGRVIKFMEKTNMKSVFCAGAGIQSVLFFLNDGYLSATLACGSGVSPRTVRWGGTLLPQAVGRAMEWPDSCPRRKLPERTLYAYFLIRCKCFIPSSKRSRKASTSSGVLSAQKDTRMAVSMASGLRPMAASVWLGWPRPEALADET